MHAFSQADGLPADPVPTAIAEDRFGSIWIGLFHGGLARYRQGRFTVFRENDGVRGSVQALYSDSTGRLWIGSTQGLLRLDDPSRDRPGFIRYDTTSGLSSSDVAAITEDSWGRIYAATGRGIDRFQPRAAGPARVQHYTTADGRGSRERP